MTVQVPLTTSAASHRYILKRSSLPQVPYPRNPIIPSTSINRDPESLRSASYIQNEASALAYLRDNTSIPVHSVVATFKDRGCSYLMLDCGEGSENWITLKYIPTIARMEIYKKVNTLLHQLTEHTRLSVQSFGTELCLPPTISPNEELFNNGEYSEGTKYVLCHGDLRSENILVDRDTHQVKCVLGWEFAGFYPQGIARSMDEEASPSIGKKGHATESLLEASDRFKRGITDEVDQAITSPAASVSVNDTEGEPESRDGKDSSGSISQEQSSCIPKRKNRVTALQQRLRALDIGLHPDEPREPWNIALRTATLTRYGLASDHLSAAHNLHEDYLAMKAWTALDVCKMYFSDLKYMKLNQLNSGLSGLEVFRQHLVAARFGQELLVKKTKEERILARGAIKSAYESAYRHAEGGKWKAIQTYARELLRYADIANKLLDTPAGTSANAVSFASKSAYARLMEEVNNVVLGNPAST